MIFEKILEVPLFLIINLLLIVLNSVRKAVSKEDKEEKELIKKVKNGDKIAFNILVENYQKKIYHLARRIVMNHEDADEVVQETFIKAYINISKFSEEHKFYTWLYRIAVNTSLSLIKKRRYRGLSLEALTENEHFQPTSGDDTHQSSQDSEIKNLVKEALKKLSPQLRTVFMLRTWEEMSYKEIAQTLKISEGTVMSRLNRARNKLKKLLKKTDGYC